jgi:probable HAF family extracellular repeat protein
LTLGGSSSSGFAINDLGQIVGQSRTDPASIETHAFVVPRGRSFPMVDLGTLGGIFSRAFGINNRGQVVGGANLPSAEEHPFLVTPEDTDGDGTPDRWFRDDDFDGVNDLMLDLGVLSSAFVSSASDVNELGQVVGRSGPNMFVWTPSAGMLSLGAGRARAINDLGQIAGDGAGVGVAFLITPEDSDGDGTPDRWFRDDDFDGVNDLLTDYPPLTPGASAFALDLDESGVLVGGETDPGFPATGERRALRWTSPSQVVDLGKLDPASNFAQANAVNGVGQIVGGALTDSGDTHAVFWSEAEGIIDLGTLGGASSLADDINELGQLVGSSENAAGEFRAFVAKLRVRAETPTSPGPVTIAVQPLDATPGILPVTVMFANVTTEGTTTLNTSLSGPAPPSGFQLGDPPAYFDFTTTAEFGDPVIVCIDYSLMGFTNEAALMLDHFEDTDGDGIADDWVDRTVSKDPVNNIICASVDTFSLFAVFEPAALSVVIDIKPGSDPNCFNANGHGVIPVAILGSSTFDVTLVDLSTLSFGGLEVRVRGNKGPLCNFEDSDGDTILDLVCHFEDDPTNWAPGDGDATLTGTLIDGTTEFVGTDTICVVP